VVRRTKPVAVADAEEQLDRVPRQAPLQFAVDAAPGDPPSALSVHTRRGAVRVRAKRVRAHKRRDVR
jgi:hypothetical protein